MMESSKGRRRRASEAGINLTPLIDVMFNLMIFILMTAQYSNIYSMKVDLPKAEMSEKTGEKEVVTITLTEDEKIYFGEEIVGIDALETKLKELSSAKAPPQVILRADNKSTTGKLVEVMDLVQKVGLRRVSLQTEK